MKSKLKIVLPIALVLAGAAYKLVLAKPTAAKAKIDGVVYVLPREFVLNLSDGHLAKVDVALVLKAAPTAGGEAAMPPEGYGALPEEAAVRDIVTNTITGERTRDLVSQGGRERVKKQILRAIRASTDVEATGVLLTDVAVQ
jgi:flagellar basal body-associated protein FliL